MKKLQFKRIGILIGIVLLITIGVQAWRIYTQFQIIRDQVNNDIQLSLDNAVENYFAELAKTDIVTLADDRFFKKIGLVGWMMRDQGSLPELKAFEFLATDQVDRSAGDTKPGLDLRIKSIPLNQLLDQGPLD